MREQRVGNDEQHKAGNCIERGKCQPQNAQQPNVLLHAVRQRTNRGNGLGELFATSAAKTLVRLHSGAASIAEHRASFALHPDTNYWKIRTGALVCFKLNPGRLPSGKQQTRKTTPTAPRLRPPIRDCGCGPRPSSCRGPCAREAERKSVPRRLAKQTSCESPSASARVASG